MVGFVTCSNSPFFFYDSDLELASSNDHENASVHSGGDTTPVMERKAVRFLSRDNSLGVEDKVAYLSNIHTMSDESTL